MKRLLLIAALALMGCNTKEVGNHKSAIELVELPQPKSNQVTIRLMFRMGSVDDPQGKQGLTSLTAGLISDGGSKKYTKSEIDELLYPMAVGMGQSVDKETTVFTMTSHKDNVAAAYEILAGMLLEPRFDESDYERVMKNAMQAVTDDIPQSNDEVLSKRVLDGLMFANHPYADLVQGTESGLNNITLEDVKAHYATYLCQKRLMIGLAGGYDAAFKEQLLSDMAKLPVGSDKLVDLPVVPMPKGIEARIVSKEQGSGTAIFMGYPLAIDRSSDEFAALMVANSYLGEHRKSYGVLYNSMRSTRSLNYGDYSYIEWYPAGHVTQLPFPGTPRRQNFFSIWIRPVQTGEGFKGVKGMESPELGNGAFAIRQSLRELRKLVDNGMTQDDFERTRKFLMGYTKLYVQRAGTRLGFLMDSRFYNRQDYIGELAVLLEKLTLEDVNGAIKKYLQADNMYLSVITDDSEADKLAERLKSNTSAPIVYNPVMAKGLGKTVTDEDSQIDGYQLNVTKIEVVKNTTLFK